MKEPEQPAIRLPARRGPAPSGDSRSEIEKRSAKKLRVQRYESGLVDLKTFVSGDTRTELLELKKRLNLRNLGEVIEHLVKNQK